MTNPMLILDRVLPNAYMALGYYLWVSDYKQVVRKEALGGKFSEDFIVKVETDYMEFGLLEGSLVAFRKFDDFFKKKEEGKSDDLHVSDFFSDYQIGGYLSLDERREINKTVAHLTTFEAPLGSVKSNALDMTRRFIEKFMEFCEFVMEADTAVMPDEVSAVAQTFRELLVNYHYTLRNTDKEV